MYELTENVHLKLNMFFFINQEPEDFNYYGNYLAKPEVRAAIHVGNLTYNSGTQVEIHLMNDVMDTVKPWIATLMENYKVSVCLSVCLLVGLPVCLSLSVCPCLSGCRIPQLKKKTILANFCTDISF